MTPPLIDFLPPDYKERRSRRRVWLFRGGITLALGMAMAFATVAVEQKSGRVERELAVVRGKHEQARLRIAQVEHLDRQKEELSHRLGVLRDILVRARGALVLEAVGRSCPESARFTKVDLRVSTTGTEPRVDVTVEGRCPDHLDVANLLGALSDQPLLSNVRMVLSEDVDSGTPEKKFVIIARSPGLLTEELVRGRR